MEIHPAEPNRTDWIDEFDKSRCAGARSRESVVIKDESENPRHESHVDERLQDLGMKELINGDRFSSSDHQYCERPESEEVSPERHNRRGELIHRGFSCDRRKCPDRGGTQRVDHALRSPVDPMSDEMIIKTGETQNDRGKKRDDRPSPKIFRWGFPEKNQCEEDHHHGLQFLKKNCDRRIVEVLKARRIKDGRDGGTAGSDEKKFEPIKKRDREELFAIPEIRPDSQDERSYEVLEKNDEDRMKCPNGWSAKQDISRPDGSGDSDEKRASG